MASGFSLKNKFFEVSSACISAIFFKILIQNKQRIVKQPKQGQHQRHTNDKKNCYQFWLNCSHIYNLLFVFLNQLLKELQKQQSFTVGIILCISKISNMYKNYIYK